jgi:CDP-glucose 4,6-dehydratase
MTLQNKFQGKTVLVTGHTGFKGAWLTAWLKLLGANVVGIALDPPSQPSHFNAAKLMEGIKDLRIDIRDRKNLEYAVHEAKPDFIFHLAAQALVRRSYEDPKETWDVNLTGTLNLLDILRRVEKPCVAVFITSDKCYDNVEWVWGYKETDALGGPDPYSASKGGAELAIRSYIKSYFPKATSAIRIAVARAGNVIGGGDWAVDRIVPDCVRAWSNGLEVELRNPNSTRPWQHVLEPLSGYLSLAAALTDKSAFHGEPFNFGPLTQQNHTVLDLVQQMALDWRMVKWRDVSNLSSGPYESELLKLNCDKALHYLKWHAVMDFTETVSMTAQWYGKYYEGTESISNVTYSQIRRYTELANMKGLFWAQQS